MKHSLYLAYTFVFYHQVRSLVLMLSIGLVLFLPFGLKKLINESEQRMMARGRSTPLIIGPKGSSTDLALNTLYFRQEQSSVLRVADLEKVNAAGFGHAIPVTTMFKARNFPIVGTDLDYFQFRNLELQHGRWMSYLGECVIGSNVAAKLSIGVGDSLVSSSENLFDLAGVYPLKMEVVGVLSRTDTPDDQAIFADIKTNWAIMGLGHGHEDLTTVADQSVVLKRDSSSVTAGAKLYTYNTISEKNLDSFHFHGDMRDYPITAMIFLPNDHKSETLLRGRFESGAFPHQVIVPAEVIGQLLEKIFRIRHIFNMVFVLVGLATLMILGLMVTLSVRLRKDEMYTMYAIGSSVGKTLEIITFELLIVLTGSVLFAICLYMITGTFTDDFIQKFII